MFKKLQRRRDEEIDKEFLHLMSIKENEMIPLSEKEQQRKTRVEGRLAQLEKVKHSKRIERLTNSHVNHQHARIVTNEVETINQVG